MSSEEIPSKFTSKSKAGDTGLWKIRVTYPGKEKDLGSSYKRGDILSDWGKTYLYRYIDYNPYTIGVTDVRLTREEDCPSGYEQTSDYKNSKGFYDIHYRTGDGGLRICQKREYGKPKIKDIRTYRTTTPIAKVSNYSLELSPESRILTIPNEDSHISVRNLSYNSKTGQYDKEYVYIVIEQDHINDEDARMKKFCNAPNLYNALFPSCREWCLNHPGQCDSGVKFACNSDLMTKEDNELFGGYCSCVNPAVDLDKYDINISNDGKIAVCQSPSCRIGGYKTYNQSIEGCTVLDCSILINNTNTGIQTGQEIAATQACQLHLEKQGSGTDDETTTPVVTKPVVENKNEEKEPWSLSWIEIILILFVIILFIALAGVFAMKWFFTSR